MQHPTVRRVRFFKRWAAAALTLAALAAVAVGPQAFVPSALAADVKELKLDAAQQDAATKLRAKGAAVTQIAADTDAMSVNLGIVGKQATDADLALVKVLPKVQQLDLHNTGITDAGLADIAGQTGLTQLHLNNTAITDAGLEKLKGLTSLDYLNLYGTAVTDAGLKNLEGLKKLRKVYLWQTKVTDAGAKSLKAAVPEVIINRGEELAVAATKPAVAAAAPVAPPAPNATVPKKGKGKKPAKPGAAVADIDAEGFIRTWLVFGPISFDGQPAEELDKAQLPDEGKLKPKDGDKAKVKDKEVAWKKVMAAEFSLDFNEVFKVENPSNVAAYAVAYVEAPEEVKDVTLLMGSNDEGKVYLNGKELAKFATARTLDKDTEKAEGLTLAKGVNVIVLKVINESNNWQGCVRLAGKDGKPVAGLKIVAAPQ